MDNSTLEDNSQSSQTIKVFIEYRLIREFVSFQKQNFSHIYIVPSYESAYRWNGVMFIHHGLYADAILKFFVDIPENYPTSECPKIRFDPIPFHPLIDPQTGQLNTAREFPVWKPNINQIWHVILFARKIFYNLENELTELQTPLVSTPSGPGNLTFTDPLLNPPTLLASQNEEEFQRKTSIDLGEHYRNVVSMYKNRFSEFQAKIDETIKLCHAKLYDFEETDNQDHDLHAIQFGPWDPKEHEILRNKLKRGVDITEEFKHLSLNGGNSGGGGLHKKIPSTPKSTSGLSWVDKGNIFSKQSLQ